MCVCTISCYVYHYGDLPFATELVNKSVWKGLLCGTLLWGIFVDNTRGEEICAVPTLDDIRSGKKRNSCMKSMMQYYSLAPKIISNAVAGRENPCFGGLRDMAIASNLAVGRRSAVPLHLSIAQERGSATL